MKLSELALIMLSIFIQIFPFFALIGIGFFAARIGFFGDEATGNLTRFVFYFALPAMLFGFAADLRISDIFDGRFVAAYLMTIILVYSIVSIVSWSRKVDMQTSAIEAQCAVFGNSGFMAIPMMLGLFGEQAVPALLMVLAIDVIVTGNMAVIMITAARNGSFHPRMLKFIGVGLVKNPMFLSVAAGLLWSVIGAGKLPAIDASVKLLGAAATPLALFVIGASLAQNRLDRVPIALWLSFCKLIAMPAICAFFALYVFKVEPFAASIMIGVAAMPSASTVYIVARSYNVAANRASATILVSTVISIMTLTFVLKYIGA